MTLDTIFDVASLTKPVVTATLALQLAAAGKIELDGPAARYLPELARWNGGAASVPHFLIHESGLPVASPLAHYSQGPAAALAHVRALRPLAPAVRAYSGSKVCGGATCSTHTVLPRVELPARVVNERFALRCAAVGVRRATLRGPRW
jgi:hypothetical protein